MESQGTRSSVVSPHMEARVALQTSCTVVVQNITTWPPKIGTQYPIVMTAEQSRCLDEVVKYFRDAVVIEGRKRNLSLQETIALIDEYQDNFIQALQESQVSLDDNRAEEQLRMIKYAVCAYNDIDFMGARVCLEQENEEELARFAGMEEELVGEFQLWEGDLIVDCEARIQDLNHDYPHQAHVITRMADDIRVQYQTKINTLIAECNAGWKERLLEHKRILWENRKRSVGHSRKYLYRTYGAVVEYRDQ